MKILELRFKNLNSLYGEWSIDFTAPEYTANGIFALTGPTGAGKSTILDAICLALYGATPRLGKITKNNNEIMSRQTGECFAEVLFASQNGRFRCHWSQHRARKKATGNLAETRHEIADAETGRILEVKKRNVADAIEKKTGMDFDRFTRSMLLAQGGFDTFLKADIEQKSKILEQITGTGIYTEISQRVHERYREEREKLNLLKAETSGIIILEPESEKEVISALQKRQRHETELANQVSTGSKAVNWLKEINRLQDEIKTLEREFSNLANKEKEFAPERERLHNALKAGELDGIYATLNGIRKQQQEDKSKLNQYLTELSERKLTLSRNEETLQKAEQLTAETKRIQQTAAPLLQKIRALDLQIEDREKSISVAEADCKKETAQITTAGEQLQNSEKKCQAAQKNLSLTLNYLETNAYDKLLTSELSGIEAQLNNLLSVQKSCLAKKETVNKLTLQLETAVKTAANQQKKLDLRQAQLKSDQKLINLKKNELQNILNERLLREYRAEKDNLMREMAFLRTIADLKSERKKLKDGRECPLCGAKEHPFAVGNIPTTDATEKKIQTLNQLIDHAEKIESEIIKLEQNEKKSLKKVTDNEKQVSAAALNKKSIAKNLQDLSDEINKDYRQLDDLEKSALNKLAPLNIFKLPEELSSLLKTLQKRLINWQKQERKHTEITQQITDYDSEIKRIEAVISTRTQALSEKQEILTKLQKELTTLRTERQNLFGNKNPDQEEMHLDLKLRKAESTEKTARAARDKTHLLLHSLEENIKSLNENIKQRSTRLKLLESEFKKALNDEEFSDEQHFKACRLSASERSRLKEEAQNLDEAKIDLEARQKDRKNRLTREKGKKITNLKLDELEPQQQILEDKLKELRDKITGLKHKLTENQTAQERIKEKQAAITAQKLELDRWETLHNIIGSADGKKYRNFAQGLTFELMVKQANLQLKKMSDRYILSRSQRQPLELNVIDNYQAGEIRSTRNLSGGESFIVSLTLALGLAKMASRKIRVDSLFLDEGFGSLDEETLEIALETLAHLQQDGKLIGTISHIPALKERISTQINIIPKSGGRSTITGPGVLYSYSGAICKLPGLGSLLVQGASAPQL